MIEYLGLWVLLALALNMWAVISVLEAPVSLVSRGLWCLILLLPVLGFVAWYIFGPRGRRV